MSDLTSMPTLAMTMGELSAGLMQSCLVQDIVMLRLFGQVLQGGRQGLERAPLSHDAFKHTSNAMPSAPDCYPGIKRGAIDQSFGRNSPTLFSEGGRDFRPRPGPPRLPEAGSRERFFPRGAGGAAAHPAAPLSLSPAWSLCVCAIYREESQSCCELVILLPQ